MTWRIVLQLALSGLSIGSIYALVGLALVLPFKASGIVNFAQGEIVTFGAYLALILSGLGLPYLAVVPLVLVGAAVFGMAIERLLIRPIVNQSEFTLVIVTFAIGFIIKAAIRLHWQDNTFSIDAPFVGPPWCSARCGSIRPISSSSSVPSWSLPRCFCSLATASSARRCAPPRSIRSRPS